MKWHESVEALPWWKRWLHKFRLFDLVMKAIMRGGPKDGLEIELDGKSESVRFPAFPEPNRNRRSHEESPFVWGQIVYHRTERLEGDSVVFI